MFKKVEWTLVDSSHRCFNLWMSDIGRYLECFDKHENPNLTKPYGNQMIGESLVKRRNAMTKAKAV